MKNLFDYNAQANTAVMGGNRATQAVGLPVPGALPGSFAPGGSGATGDAMLQQMRERTQGMIAGLQAPARRGPARIGYNPNTDEFFSQGKTFKADLNEGRQAAAAGFFDVDNESLPEGFVAVPGENAKRMLEEDYANQDIIDDFQRRVGQFTAGAGSTLRDLGAPNVGLAIEQAGSNLAARNPSQINQASDILDKPLTTAGEAIGEMGFDAAKALGTGWAGAKAGTAAGAALAPFTGGASIPIGTILGGAAGIFLPTLFETYGSVRREQREQGIDDRGRALAAGTGSAALEAALGPEAVIGRMLTRKTGVLAARDLLEQGALKSVGRKTAAGAVVEGPLTEVPQEAMERWGAYKPTLGEEALNEYIIAGTKGAIGGGGMTTLTATAEYMQASSFANNLLNDQRTAADPTVAGPTRLAAARRVQDVLSGVSSDPQFNQQLQEFRQTIARLEANMASLATAEALADGTPLNLMESRPAFYERGEQVETTTPGSLDAYAPPPAMGREPRAPVVIDEGPLQQIQTTRPEDIQGPPVNEMNRLNAVLDSSGLQAFGPGIFPPGPDTTLGGFEARPVQPAAAPQAPFTGDPTTLGGFEGAPAVPPPAPLTPTQQNIQSVLDAVPSLDLDAPAAPAPAPLLQPQAPQQGLVQVETRKSPPPPATSPAGASTPAAQPAAGGSLERAVEAEMAKLDGENIPDPLAAEVEGEIPRVPGRATLSTKSVANIAALLYNPNETTRAAATPQETKIADAIRSFAEAASEESKAIANIKRKQGEGIRTKAGQTRAALTRLRKVVGNAKDVEAIVRTVKDAVQKELFASKDQPDLAKAFTRLDTMLSSAWNNAKAGRYRGTTDTMAVTQSPIRQSQEATEAGVAGRIESVLKRGWLMFQGYPDEATEKAKAAAEEHKKKTKTPYKTEERDDGKIYFSEKDNTLYLRSDNSLAEVRGVLGLLNYLRQAGTKQTPFQSMLANALYESISRGGRAFPEVKIGDKPGYDPKTDTIYIRADESPAISLHEVLHAATQWFVYSNPKHEAVVSLKASLKQVIDYKGDLPAKAKAVQDLLKALVQKGNETDAVLELVAYGNTLNDFRKAMQAMPSKGVPKSFMESVNSVWQKILNTIATLLGKSPNVASDVVQATLKLLQDASKTVPPDARVGERLDAAVDLYGPTLGAQMPSATPVLQGAGLSRYNKRFLPRLLTSKVLFDAVGYQRVADKASEAATKVSAYISKNLPGLSSTLQWVDSHFGLNQYVRDSLIASKDERRGGSAISESLAHYFTQLPPTEAVAVLEYMDQMVDFKRGRRAEPTLSTPDTKLQELAKATAERWVELAGKIRDPKLRAKFEAGNISRSFVLPESAKQIASQSYGIRNVTELTAARVEREPNLDAVDGRKNSDGDMILDDIFYGVYTAAGESAKQIAAGMPTAKVKPDYYISAALYDPANPPANSKVDTVYGWEIKRSGKDYKFTARLDAKQALLAGRAINLNLALQNTMHILANNAAFSDLSDSLVALQGDDQVAFDDLKSLNAWLGKGNELSKDQIVRISAQESRSDVVKNLYRSRSRFVQLPNSPTFGAMAGKIVQGSVWSAIEDSSNRRPLVDSAAYNGIMRWFKASKTVYNPATWTTNVATNFTFAMMADVPMATIAHASRLYALYHVAPQRLSRAEIELMTNLMKTNGLLADFSSVEIKRSLYETMRDTIEGPEKGVVERMLQLTKMEKSRIEKINGLMGTAKDKVEAGQKLAEGWYSAQDNVFRVAAMLQYLGEAEQSGKPITAETYRLAGDHARFSFLDYDIDAKAIRVMRQTAFPFISWPYAAARLIGHVAVHKPWKMVNLYAGYMVAEALLQAMAGDDDEEDAQKRKSGPEWARERLLFGFGPHAYLRVPFLGDDKNPVYYNFGKYIAPSSLGDTTPNGFLGQSWWPQAITPGGPFLTSAVILLGGVDPFTNKPINSPTASDFEKTINYAKYMQSMMAPNIPGISTRELDKAIEAFSGRSDRTSLYDDLYVARQFGLRMYDFNVDQAQIQQGRAVLAIKSEFQKELSAMRRKVALQADPDYEAFYARRTELIERMMERMAEARGEE